MKKLIKINVDDTYKISKKIINFLNPEYSCVFLKDYNNINNLKKINKYSLINKDDFFSFSSISGEVIGTVEINISNRSKKALFIKNDFKEKEATYNVKKVKTKEDFLDLFMNTPYHKIFNKKFSNIVINGISDEPLNKTNSLILKYESDNIVDTTNFITSLFSLEKSIIAIKDVENDNITQYLSKIGSFKNMSVEMVNDLYLMSKTNYLLNHLNLNEKETVILSPNQVLEIRKFLKFNRLSANQYITVVNTISKKVKLLRVKKNCLVSEVINKLKLSNDNYEYIKNGVMSGKIININKEIISDDFSALFILEKKTLKKEKCINCGKCYEVCPSPKKCINCNLCKYVCPSNLKKRGVIK